MDDLAGRAYWDATWSDEALPAVFDPARPGLHHHVARSLHAELRGALEGVPTQGRRLLEIGCARSAFLPYLARTFGFAVHGLDYSPAGAEQARRVLRREGVPGEVTCADLFAPPAELLGAFDVVVSFGVMEHFADTAAALRAAARFLGPAGRLITLIPNLAGAIGWIQKRLNRPVYDVHNPLDREALEAAARGAGLAVLACRYAVAWNFGVLNLHGVPANPLRTLKRGVIRLLNVASLAGWLIEERVRPLPAGRAFGAYLLAVASLPARAPG